VLGAGLILALALSIHPPMTGVASYYGESHRGKAMANGKPFNPDLMTGAMWKIPFGARVRVTNIKNGKSVVIIITDRGPAKRLNRILDVSERAARELGMIWRGTADVKLEICHDH
jgi:rare lipoprotein A